LGLVVPVEVVQVQAVFFKKGTDGFRLFPLVGKHKCDIRVNLLGFFQNRHFPDAGWAPGRPEVHHQGLARSQLGHVDHVAIERSQGNVRHASGLLFDQRDRSCCACPKQEAS
jgi:hypothetical protein